MSQRLTLLTGERLTASAAVGVEYNDVLFVGEVLNSTPGAEGQWMIDIKVVHTLPGLESLTILRAQFQQPQSVTNDVAPAARSRI